MPFIYEHELAGDTNTTHHVQKIYNKFQTIIV
jgi:hypothetical protein